MSDHVDPSPVRASAQETADALLKAIYDAVYEVAGKDAAEAFDDRAAVVAALSAAEARGRQQAEQAQPKCDCPADYGKYPGDPNRHNHWCPASPQYVPAILKLQEAEKRAEQAEQARDALQQKLNVYEIDLSERVFALTQALKDYGQHRATCSRIGGYVTSDGMPYPCTCGFDAALTGANHAST